MPDKNAPSFDKKTRLDGMFERFTKSIYPLHANRVLHKSPIIDKCAHFHDYAQLFYCIRGTIHFRVGDDFYECVPGSLLITPPGTAHDFTVDDNCITEFIVTDIMPSFLDNLTAPNQLQAAVHLFLSAFSDELAFSPAILTVFEGERRAAAESFFTRLSSYNWRAVVNPIESLREKLCDIFLFPEFSLSEKTLSRAAQFLCHKFVPIMKTVYYMNINYNKIIHRDELISMSNICQTDYFRFIKRLIGCTYSTYMQWLRTRRAIYMATFSPYSLSYIADICGFCDLAYMEKSIKKLHPGSQLPSKMKKGRSSYIKSWPFSIKSRSEYEGVCPQFYAYGLQQKA